MPPNAAIKPLELADQDAKVNDWVWVAGQEQGRAFQLYLAKVTKVQGGTYRIMQQEPYNPHGFSGGPVLTADGKVMGNTLAGHPTDGSRQGATVSNIRVRIGGF